MINAALERGSIKKGDRLVEATSGNTGIALAMIARIMGLEMTLVMPDNSTRERVLSMEAYGAKVILTPADRTIEYSRQLAEEMATNDGYHMLDQFANPDNYAAHVKTTAGDLAGYKWHDNPFCVGDGTTGTLWLFTISEEKNRDVQIVGTQPTDTPAYRRIRRWSPEFLPRILINAR